MMWSYQYDKCFCNRWSLVILEGILLIVFGHFLPLYFFAKLISATFSDIMSSFGYTSSLQLILWFYHCSMTDGSSPKIGMPFNWNLLRLTTSLSCLDWRTASSLECSPVIQSSTYVSLDGVTGFMVVLMQHLKLFVRSFLLDYHLDVLHKSKFWWPSEISAGSKSFSSSLMVLYIFLMLVVIATLWMDHLIRIFWALFTKRYWMRCVEDDATILRKELISCWCSQSRSQIVEKVNWFRMETWLLQVKCLSCQNKLNRSDWPQRLTCEKQQKDSAKIVWLKILKTDGPLWF